MNATTTAKTKPIPTRFDEPESAFLHQAAQATGMSVSELLRRSVKLMKRQKEVLNSYHFVLDLG